MDISLEIKAESYYMELADKLERDRDLSDDEFAAVDRKVEVAEDLFLTAVALNRKGKMF